LGSHAVLTSHTGLASATLFDRLADVREGDLILVDVAGETLAYRVGQIKIVLPDEISDLTTVAGRDYLTLFTCSPYAINSHRLLVRGERVPYTPEIAELAEQAPDSAFAIESWMWWLFAAAAAGLLLAIVIVIRERKGSGARSLRRRHGSRRAAGRSSSAAPSAPPPS